MGDVIATLEKILGPRWDVLYRRRRKLATAGVALLIAMLGYHVVFGANGLMVYGHKRTEYRSLQSEVEQLQQENEKLSKEIKALKTDPKTIEKEAREQLRYARPGEVIYSIPARPIPTPPSTAQKR
jgi:cell division protein FtsB